MQLHFLYLLWLLYLSKTVFTVETNATVRTTPDLDMVHPSIAEDARLTTPELIRKYGYPVEEHSVITQDGYILKLYRMPQYGRTPVLVTHGILCSSSHFVMLGPKKGLAFILFRAGYDVWLINTRGSFYSREHIYLLEKSKYWDFSFHEIGVYDLPATIDYIIKKTDFQKIYYIGYSQGTTVFWVMCSERPEYAEKILLMQALAPIAFLGHCKSPLVKFIAQFQGTINTFFSLFGQYEITPTPLLFKNFDTLVCSGYLLSKKLCMMLDFVLFGINLKQFNRADAPIIIGHANKGGSVKQLKHFAQLLSSFKFRQYDYGLIENSIRYESILPPSYKLKNVKCKVALHYSDNDWLASLKDVDQLRSALPNLVVNHLVNQTGFNHFNFIAAIDVVPLVYDSVLDTFRAFEEGRL